MTDCAPTGFLLDHAGDPTASPLEAQEGSRRTEADGYDGVLVAETRHDPFLSLALAARSTQRVTLLSGVVVALRGRP